MKEGVTREIADIKYQKGNIIKDFMLKNQKIQEKCKKKIGGRRHKLPKQIQKVRKSEYYNISLNL